MAKKKNPMSAAPLPVVTTPPTEDDMSFMRFIDGVGQRVPIMDPLSDDGLRLQAQYIQSFSQHPMDYLQRVMSNPFSDPKDRISAARTLMEYSMRKPAQNLELKAQGSVLSIPPSALAGLDDKELTLLESLLTKASKA